MEMPDKETNCAGTKLGNACP